MTAQDTCLKSQNNECKASTELTLNSVEPKRLVLEERYAYILRIIMFIIHPLFCNKLLKT